ncbi:hypothetical protein [Fructilactobacillus florum]|uniref:SpoVT-AbrB domain-containing protein n=1 Tax=Fructilactobacillus florum DSM 22689 = JCM 16035 TaxID=1423745 RepID=A0A0R2CJR6_9LACO|nr:hypothetical protein [Fructilactobacillus florum]KRM91885.1 hypothetical protein FC87_GL000710 [Fructilactobacillus florum DSM 22689 = JCM 16035]
MVVKTRKVGNSMTITIPNNIHIKSGEQFEASLDSNGNLIFKKVSNLTNNEINNINDFTQRFKPLMEKLKDK